MFSWVFFEILLLAAAPADVSGGPKADCGPSMYRTVPRPNGLGLLGAAASLTIIPARWLILVRPAITSRRRLSRLGQSVGGPPNWKTFAWMAGTRRPPIFFALR